MCVAGTGTLALVWHAGNHWVGYARATMTIIPEAGVVVTAGGTFLLLGGGPSQGRVRGWGVGGAPGARERRVLGGVCVWGGGVAEFEWGG